MVKQAIKIAQMSNGTQFRHSALLIGKGGRVLVSACNLIRKTHPRGSSVLQSCHAEIRCIAKAKAILNRNNFSGYRMICLRINRQNQIRFSKPCPCCQKQIDEVGLRVSWSNNDGTFANA